VTGQSRRSRDGCAQPPDRSLGRIAHLNAEPLEHPSDLVGGGEIALTPGVVAFAEQPVDLGGCEEELPRGRRDVLRHQVQKADGEHGLEGAGERTEVFCPKLWGA
jgi:hypothetical protein